MTTPREEMTRIIDREESGRYPDLLSLCSRLVAENERMREALFAVTNTDDHADPEVRSIVRAALTPRAEQKEGEVK